MEKPYAIICRGVTIEDGKKKRNHWFVSSRYRTLEQLLDAWNNGRHELNSKVTYKDGVRYLQYKPIHIKEFKGDLLL